MHKLNISYCNAQSFSCSPNLQLQLITKTQEIINFQLPNVWKTSHFKFPNCYVSPKPNVLAHNSYMEQNDDNKIKPGETTFLSVASRLMHITHHSSSACQIFCSKS